MEKVKTEQLAVLSWPVISGLQEPQRKMYRTKRGQSTYIPLKNYLLDKSSKAELEIKPNAIIQEATTLSTSQTVV